MPKKIKIEVPDELAPNELAPPATENAAPNGTSDGVVAPPAPLQSEASEVDDPLAGRPRTDVRALRPIIEKAFAEMGIDTTQPAMTPHELQELMLREGVRPEDNLGSRAIIEMREE